MIIGVLPAIIEGQSLLGWVIEPAEDDLIGDGDGFQVVAGFIFIGLDGIERVGSLGVHGGGFAVPGAADELDRDDGVLGLFFVEVFPSLAGGFDGGFAVGEFEVCLQGVADFVHEG